MKKRTVHLYTHTHWDQEWYFTSSRSRIYLYNHIKNLIQVLETHPEFPCYLLDAQSSLIESYLQWAPEDRARLTKLIADERLLTGPWFTQTDQLVIHQESVVRNLFYGMEVAQRHGNVMKLGYVPDCFGQGGNMPQLYRQFGIHHALFWRGIADNTLHETEFFWQGDNGDRVFALQMPWGYHYGGLLDETPETMKAFLDEKMAAIEARSHRQHLLFPHGFDQAPVRRNLPELVEQFNARDDSREYLISNPLTVVKMLEQEAGAEARTLKGELTEAKHSRVHKTIFSCRADLKLLNNEIESLLVNTLEPVLAISQSLGNAYPKHIVATIWKLMFYNAAHDSIGGCNSDDTNQDVFFRYKEAKGLAQNLLELHTRLITQRIPRQHDFTFTVFNPLPWSVAPGITFEAWLPGLPFTLRDGNGKAIPCVIESEEDLTQYVLNQTIRLDPGKAWHKPEKVCRTRLTVNSPVLPALGYDRWYIDFSEDNAARPALSQETTAENDVYHIQAEADGLLTITDKRSGKRYPRQMLFVENGDDGDSYNYSPPRADWMITSEGAMTTVQKQKSTVSQGLILRYALKVPADLAERAAGTATTTLNLKVKVVLQNDDLIRFNVEVDNNVLSHRLCVHFATDIAARVSCADQLFGAVTRPVQLGKALQCWEEERWQEKPISIEPMQSYVNLHDEQHGFTLHTNGVREYEIVGDDFNTLSLTLFRTFGFMGKENLLYRPGRASGESIVETPDAQLLKTMTFSFGWRTYLGTFDEAQHARVSKTWLTEFPVYQDSDFLNGRLRFCLNDEVRDYPETYSALSLPATHRDALVSAVKCAEDHSGIIIRFYNPHLETDVVIPPLQDARCVMLDEMTPMQARQTLKPNDVQTVLIKRI